MDHTAAWFACEIRKNPTRRGTYDEMEINENDKVTGRNPAQEKFAEKSLKYKNSAERKAYGIRKLQAVDKVPAKAGLFYTSNRFSGTIEVSERRCFL